MDRYDYWRLCDQLSILQAAILMCGDDPSGEMQYVDGRDGEQQPIGYEASKSALIGWIQNEQVEGFSTHEFERDLNGYEETDRIDLRKSWVNVESLRQMLHRRGFCDGFFVQDERKSRGYLDPDNEFYPPKLAAAVNAWETVTAVPSLTNGKTPKQALEKWLREHANDYGLTGNDGNPVSATIDHIAKVANWRPEGGASKTPTHTQVQENPIPSEISDDNQDLIEEDPDPIPF